MIQHSNSFRNQPDDRGHFGEFGGRFVAETLMPLVLDLEREYRAAQADPAFAARWRGPYLDDVALPLDPWNSPYQYAVPGRDGLPFALYSWGADRQAGGTGDAQDLGVLPAQ